MIFELHTADTDGSVYMINRTPNTDTEEIIQVINDAFHNNDWCISCFGGYMNAIQIAPPIEHPAMNSF